MSDWERPFEEIEIGRARLLSEGKDIAVLSIGHPGNDVATVVKKLEKESIGVTHWDMRFVSPLDREVLHSVFKKFKKIITVEDPVEYQMEGVNQIQAKPQIGLTFASALRSIVRQDPDVIMIGEMRDLETARIAVQSALTGHLVLSTLHTNDAAGGITRLLDMGLEEYLLTSTILGILAQRLVRKLCPACKQGAIAAPEIVKELRLQRFVPDGDIILYKPIGCPACAGSGYRGRLAIIEFLPMTDPLRKLIMGHEEAGAIQKLAIAEGMQTLYENGLVKVTQGVTTLDEVMRVTSET